MNWFTVFERFGLPTGLLILFIVVSFRIGRFIRPQIERLVDSHLKTLRCVRRSVRMQNRLMEQNSEELKIQGRRLQVIHQVLVDRPPINGKV